MNERENTYLCAMMQHHSQVEEASSSVEMQSALGPIQNCGCVPFPNWNPSTVAAFIASVESVVDGSLMNRTVGNGQAHTISRAWIISTPTTALAPAVQISLLRCSMTVS